MARTLAYWHRHYLLRNTKFMTIEIREYREEDMLAVLGILREIVAAGEYFCPEPGSSDQALLDYWFGKDEAVFVDVKPNGAVVGSYYIRPNMVGLGNHVCNAGYAVSSAVRGQGIAALMCEHSQQTAKAFGYRAMQFNAVVATNLGAIHLWQKHGFRVIGQVPQGFRHSSEGFVDLLIMWKSLID